MKGTPVSRIFKKFLSRIDDKEWLIADEDIIEDMMLEYLDSATVYFTQSRKDLSFSNLKRKVYISDISETEDVKSPYEILLPKETGDILSVRVVDIASGEELEEDVDFEITNIEDTDYYEPKVNIISSSKPTKLQITYTLEGYFQEKLSPLEIVILATAMELSYIRPKILTQESLKQFVSDKDFTKLSGANMLLRLMGLKKNLENELDVLQGKYAFEGFVGWN